AHAGLHADQAWRQVGKSRFDLATRPFLPEHDRTTPIVPYNVERVLADIDADHGDCAGRFLGHGVLLFGAPNQLRQLAGLEHGRTIPLVDLSHNASITVRGYISASLPAPRRKRHLLIPIAYHRHYGWAVWIDPVVLRAITISWNNERIPVRSWPYHGHPDDKPLPWFANHFGRPRLGC